MLGQSCKQNLIASSNACEVWACEDCGTICLNIGPVTMRLKQAHFMKAVETLREASYRLNTFYSDTEAKGGLNRDKLHH